MTCKPELLSKGGVIGLELSVTWDIEVTDVTTKSRVKIFLILQQLPN